MNKYTALLAVLVFAQAPVIANAQPNEKTPVIGYIDSLLPAQSKPYRDAFDQVLRERGWIEGKTVITQYRSTAGRPDQYAALAAEVVGLKVNLIVAGGDAFLLTLKKTTSTIPIVMTGVGDPVGSGIVASLARPGGNITGMSNLAVGLPGKWIGLLKEMSPRITRVAILRNTANPTHDIFVKEAESGAVQLKTTLIGIGYKIAAELDDAIARIVAEKAMAVLILPDPIVNVNSKQIAALTLRYKLPSAELYREGIAAGGLLSYGPNRLDNYRRAADYVDRILRGAKPGDLPVQQPVKFDLFVNSNTAKALGISVPQSVLLQAEEVIR